MTEILNHTNDLLKQPQPSKKHQLATELFDLLVSTEDPNKFEIYYHQYNELMLHMGRKDWDTAAKSPHYIKRDPELLKKAQERFADSQSTVDIH